MRGASIEAVVLAGKPVLQRVVSPSVELNIRITGLFPRTSSNGSAGFQPAFIMKQAARMAALPNEIDTLHHFDNTRIMETIIAVDKLAALGHETRLAIFRLLVQAGPDGVNAGAIGEQLAQAPATLSFHLAHLSRVGLITARQESRFIYYAADYAAMDDLIAYLTDNCCNGGACLPKTASAAAPRARRRAKASS